MTTWVILQNTDFCPTRWEERIYNCVIGVIYCFDFFNLCEGRSRYRVLAFYSITVVQNIVFLTIYVIYFKGSLKSSVFTVSMIMIVGGTLIGLTSMLLYYGRFHPAGRIEICKTVNNDIETASQRTVDKTGTLRSLKHRWHASVLSIPHSVDLSQVTTVSDDITADKKSLLTNIVQSSEFVEEGIVNQSCEITDEAETVVKVIVENSNVIDANCTILQNYASSGNTSNTQNITNEILHSQMSGNYQNFSRPSLDVATEDDYVECNNMETLRRQKRRGICSPVELGLETDDAKSDDLNSSLQSQKRRGICSSAQLGLELVTDEDNYVEKNFKFEQRRQMEATESEIDFNLNSFEENPSAMDATGKELLDIPDSIKDRERLDTPVISETDKISESDKISEEISQKEDTMSHVTSVHDYENVCPLGIARPPWCIRSWKGYTDIETYIHDDSVVRDRRRDTLTSSATGTTFSSEFSDPTCTSPAPRKALKRSRQDDYLDTLVYDLEDWESNVTSNEEVSTSTLSDIDEEEANLFVAKPIVIDDKGGMFALDTILEEREDSVSSSDTGVDLRRAKNCSVSTLVATIDEIRKCSAENSPRHVYHRTETQWEDLDPKMFIKKVQLAKVLFSNDLNKFSPCKDTPHSSLIFNTSREIEAMKEMTKCYSTSSIRRTPLINAILSDSPILGPKAKIQKYNSIADNLDISNLEEHNVYVEMRPLIPEKSDQVRKMIPTVSLSTLSRSNLRSEEENFRNMTLELEESGDEDFTDHESAVIQCLENYEAPLVTFSRSIDTGSEILSDCESPVKLKATAIAPNSNFSYPMGLHSSYEKRRRNVNRPRRKFSLLRERFEPKSERLIYTVTPQNRSEQFLGEPRTMLYFDQSKMNACDKQMSIILNDKFNAEDFTACYDKENLTPAVTSRISHWNTFINEHNSSNSERIENKDSTNSMPNLKEKRSIFLKQVLSPPKFQNWGKKRTFSPNAKIVPKAL